MLSEVFNFKVMSKRTNLLIKIINEEIQENEHPENVENVIFWALQHYAQRGQGTWGENIAYAIKERILEEEKEAEKSTHLTS
jgi:hypothetical protein